MPSKTDLRARPISHHKKDSIEAHLTIVLAALAIARDPQTAPASRSGRSSELKPLRDVTINALGHDLTATTPPNKRAATILENLKHRERRSAGH